MLRFTVLSPLPAVTLLLPWPNDERVRTIAHGDRVIAVAEHERVRHLVVEITGTRVGSIEDDVLVPNPGLSNVDSRCEVVAIERRHSVPEVGAVEINAHGIGVHVDRLQSEVFDPDEVHRRTACRIDVEVFDNVDDDGGEVHGPEVRISTDLR